LFGVKKELASSGGEPVVGEVSSTAGSPVTATETPSGPIQVNVQVRSKNRGAFLKVSMTIRGVEIIPPSDSRDAWELVFLIKSLLTWVGTQGRGAKADIETAQRRLKLPPGEYVSQGY
jgi:hypothetical protein